MQMRFLFVVPRLLFLIEVIIASSKTRFNPCYETKAKRRIFDKTKNKDLLE